VSAVHACDGSGLDLGGAASAPLEDGGVGLVDDRPPSPDIESISELITSGSLERACALDVK